MLTKYFVLKNVKKHILSSNNSFILLMYKYLPYLV